jgi:hypothetical protein
MSRAAQFSAALLGLALLAAGLALAAMYARQSGSGGGSVTVQLPPVRPVAAPGFARTMLRTPGAPRADLASVNLVDGDQVDRDQD